jgi:serine/threonine-protein kinase
MATPLDRLNSALAGRYALEHEIGQGGMATVFRAKDLRHNRAVALKVLKPELAALVGGERFLAEIETTAGLQHPHILPLYDSGSAEGFLFYVMPFVEGDSLRQLLDRERQLQVGVAVRVATAIAQALDFAHRKGIIHRDIKPANILMLDGEPVIADFGIALALSAGGAGRLTETGLSLGTPHYMSPEQATGAEHVGPAADVWALGCVTYEMLVGEPPYVASTPQAILGKIITEPAPRASRHRPSVPPNVDAAIRRSLEKLPADRFEDAQAFAKALADPGFRHGVQPEAHGAMPMRSRALALGGWAAAGVAGIALALSASRPQPPPPVQRFVLPYEAGPTFIARFPALMPDGSGLVRARATQGGLAQLTLRTWDDLDPRSIAGTEGILGGTAAVSPDGREVAFTADGQLKVAAITGGSVRVLSDSSLCCETWSPDGYIYFSTRPSRSIARVRASGGAVETVLATELQRALTPSQAIPDGDLLLFHRAAGTGANAQVVALRLSTGEQAELVEGFAARYAPSGHLIWVSMQGELRAASFDPGSLELASEHATLLDGMIINALGAGAVSLSASGTLAYIEAPSGGADLTPHQMVWVSRAGEVTPVDPAWQFTPGDGIAGWSLSPDGSRIAVRERSGEGWGIHVKQLPAGPYTRIAFGTDLHRTPRWSPDGTRVTYLTGADGDLNVWWRRADGAGDASMLFDFDRGLAEGFLSPEGDWIVMRVGSGADERIRDIYAARMASSAGAVPLLADPSYAEEGPEWSPDQRWLAYISTETDRPEIYVRPFPDVDGEKVPVSTDGGVAPKWSHDGRELFFVDPSTRQLMVAEVRTTPDFGVIQTRALFQLAEDIRVNRLEEFYDVSPDDQRFLMARVVAGGDGAVGVGRLILVQNWIEELKARVPN